MGIWLEWQDGSLLIGRSRASSVLQGTKKRFIRAIFDHWRWVGIVRECSKCWILKFSTDIGRLRRVLVGPIEHHLSHNWNLCQIGCLRSSWKEKLSRLTGEMALEMITSHRYSGLSNCWAWDLYWILQLRFDPGSKHSISQVRRFF